MSDRPLKKRLKKSSAEPEAQAGPMNGKAGRGVMGLNPLVGHKVDRFWADVSSRACCCLLNIVCLHHPFSGLHQASMSQRPCCMELWRQPAPALQALGLPVIECSLCDVQDNKWWNGIITDFNGLTGEHW